MNKKINQLGVRTAVGTDLALVGDPTTGTSYKTTFGQLPLVPYTGATGAVSLGLYGLTAGTLTLQEQALNASTYKLTQRMASNDYWSIYGFATVADYGDLYFELQDNAAFADGQRFRFHYGAASSGTPKDILVMDYNTATIDGTVKVNTLAGTSIRMVVTDSQGQLSTQAIPTLTSGGYSLSYYLNGGTAASVGTYYQMSKTAVLGTGVDFTLSGNGLISQFLTDVSDPNRLEIPGGNWNFEMYFNISSVGGNTAYYVELLKYNGTTFTSIASNVGTPEEITGGTSIDLYLTSLAIPQTTLLATDRLALRVYIVNNSGGRTVTLHTQDSHLCEIITNFAGGVSALNGLTANTQYFATGTSGTNFAIVSSGDTHTFNLPTASGTNRGALSSADWTTFSGKVPSARTLTINGTAFDLSADRSWTISSANIYTADGTLSADRTITSGGNSLTILGGKEINANIQTALILQGSATNKYVELRLQNTNASGRTYGLRSDTDGKLTILNYTLFGNLYQYDPTNTQHTFTGSQVNLTGSSISSAGLWFGTTSGTLSNYSLYGNSGITLLNATVDIRFSISNSEKFRLTTAGRLLLGTVMESTYLLDVNGTARVSGDMTVSKNQVATTNLTISNTTSGGKPSINFITDSSNEARIYKNSATSTAVKIILANDYAIENFATTGDISILNQAGSGKIKFAAGSSTTAQMTLTTAGRLLLGTTTEGTRLLDVNGLAKVGDTVYADTQSNLIVGKDGTVNTGARIALANNSNYQDFIVVNTSISSGNINTWSFGQRRDTFFGNTLGSFQITGAYFDNTGAGAAVGGGYRAPLICNPNGDVIIAGASANAINGNVSVGSATIDASAKLSVTSTTQGFLPPRMTATQKNAITTPVTGLIVYDTTLNKLCVYTTAWETITSI